MAEIVNQWKVNCRIDSQNKTKSNLNYAKTDGMTNMEITIAQHANRYIESALERIILYGYSMVLDGND